MRLVGGGITLRSVSLEKEEVNRAESTAQGTAKGGHWQARSRSLTRHKISRHLDLELLGSRNRTQYFVMPPCPCFFCHSSPNGLGLTGERNLYWCSVPDLERPDCVPTSHLSMQPRLPCSALAWDRRHDVIINRAAAAWYFLT